MSTNGKNKRDVLEAYIRRVKSIIDAHGGKPLDDESAYMLALGLLLFDVEKGFDPVLRIEGKYTSRNTKIDDEGRLLLYLCENIITERRYIQTHSGEIYVSIQQYDLADENLALRRPDLVEWATAMLNDQEGETETLFPNVLFGNTHQAQMLDGTHFPLL